MRLIINADDFGFSDGVCDGILQAMRCRRVSSTSAMVCVPGSRERLARAAGELQGRVGVHLQLTNGRPRLPPEAIPSLVDTDGRFPRHTITDVSASEVECEWRAQIDCLRALGLQPTHLDTHRHVHRDPPLLEVAATLARETGTALRGLSPAMICRLRARGVRCADACVEDWFGGDLTAQGLASVLARAAARMHRSAVVELMCHPGIVDDALRRSSRYVTEREQELATLCSDELPRLLNGLDITIVPMSELR